VTPADWAELPRRRRPLRRLAERALRYDDEVDEPLRRLTGAPA
jgi:hypothetical protein